MARRKPDPNQGELSFPGFNTGAAPRVAPSGPSSGPSGAQSRLPRGNGAQASTPSAADAYRAAEQELTAPPPISARKLGQTSPLGAGDLGQPGPVSAPAAPQRMGGWKGAAESLLTAPRGKGAPSPLTALGPWGAAADLGVRGVKAAFAPNPYGNLDSKRARSSSDEGQNLWMGRGTDKPGLYAQQTSKKYAPADGPGRPQHGGVVPFSSEVKDTYIDHGPQDYGSPDVGGPGGMAGPGSYRPAGGLAAPGPASDYMHQSRTSGTGTPWFDAHTNATSGLNAPGVAPIRAPQPAN